MGFLEAAVALRGLTEGGVLQSSHIGFLKKAADQLNDVLSWGKFCQGRGPCECADADADGVSALHLRVARSAGGFRARDAMDQFWSDIRPAASAMQSLADGGSCKKDVLLKAANICWRIGMVNHPSTRARQTVRDSPHRATL